MPRPLPQLDDDELEWGSLALPPPPTREVSPRGGVAQQPEGLHSGTTSPGVNNSDSSDDQLLSDGLISFPAARDPSCEHLVLP